MKWVMRGLGALALLVVALVAVVLAGGYRTARPVGFQMVEAPDPGGPPFAAAVWYPTVGRPAPGMLGLYVQYVVKDGPVAGHGLPLVVISHGNGGGPGSHIDLALALAQAGFVVVAPTHTGDNYADASAVGGPKWLVDRPRHVKATLDYMLGAWPGRDRIDSRRIGMFGFSAGGFTALTAIGGAPDLRRIAPHCASDHEFVCDLWKPSKATTPGPEAFVHDPRVRAAVIAAPGLGFTFVPDGLAGVTAPVQLWGGQADVNVPYATNTGLVRAALGGRVEFHSIPGAGHFSFLAPCGLVGPPLLCRDAKGFDRRAVHAAMNAAVVRFFEENLPAR